MFNLIVLYSARVVAIVAVLCLPHSPHWSNQFLILTSLLSCGYLWREHAWHYLWDNKVSKIAWVLLALIIIACSYSIAPSSSKVFVGLFKYTKILYMIFLVPLFIAAKWRRYLESALLVTVFAKIVILYYLHKCTSVNPIFVAELLAFSSFLLATRWLDSHNKYLKVFYGLTALFFSYLTLWVQPEKTGYLIYLVLLAWFLKIYVNGKKKYIIMPICVALLVMIVFNTSVVFKNRSSEFVRVASQQIVKLDAKPIMNKMPTSTQCRIDFFKYSISIMKGHYLFGYGTSSFSTAYEQSGGTKIPGSNLLCHPHSEFILFLVQWGLVGLSLLLYWLYAQWQLAKTLPNREKILLQGLVITFITHGCCDMSLYVNVPGILFVTLLGIYTAAAFARKAT